MSEPLQAGPLDHWHVRPSPLGAQLNSIAFASGTFVAVGDGGATLYSFDGANWVSHPSGTTADLYGVNYGKGLFLAVGTEIANPNIGSVPVILTSPDGINWTRRNASTNGILSGVTYGNNSYVAVGYYGSTFYFESRILTSPDGINWSSLPPVPGIALLGIACDSVCLGGCAINQFHATLLPCNVGAMKEHTFFS